METIFKKREVRDRVIETVDRDIDKFMTGADKYIDLDPQFWEKYKLGQTDAVEEWIKFPDKITYIQPILRNLVLNLKSLSGIVKILDVGSYGGYLYDYLKDNFSDFHYTGLDVQERLIRVAKERHLQENAKFVVGDIYRLKQDFEKEQFDCVCCYRVLIHLPFLKKTLENLCWVASKFVHIALRVGEKDLCIKYERQENSTGEISHYYFRTVSKRTLERIIGKELNLKYRIVVYPDTNYVSLIIKR